MFANGKNTWMLPDGTEIVSVNPYELNANSLVELERQRQISLGAFGVPSTIVINERATNEDD